LQKDTLSDTTALVWKIILAKDDGLIKIFQRKGIEWNQIKF